MGRTSSIEVLPEAIRSEIDRLLIQRVSLDDILAHLRKLSGATAADGAVPGAGELPSRSALGRYALAHKRLRERLLRSREIARGVASELGEAPGSQQMTVLTELLQTHIFDVINPMDEEEALSPAAIGLLARGLKDITTASRGNVEFMRAAEARAAEAARKDAASAAESVARARGISAETIEAIKAGIFGVGA